MEGFSPQLSLALDLIRLLAACAVVLCHFGSKRISGGVLWQLYPYGAQAVDVFFVLSGYVIGAAAQREDGAAFAVRRAARIYSVAAPALLATLALDALGRHLAPALYADMPAFAPGAPAMGTQAAAGLLFFGQWWFLDIPVGSNVPWWSLGYEVAYYLAFGLAWFGRGWWRVAGPLLVALAAGPDIVALAPLWLAGGAVLWLNRRGWPGARLGRWLAAAAVLGWMAYEAVARVYGRPFGVVPVPRVEVVQDWVIGGLFTALLAGLPAILPAVFPVGPAPRWSAAVRFFAGRSFALYLFHYPILLGLHAALLRFRPGVSPVWELPVMTAAVLAVAEVTERRKSVWQRWFGK